MKRFLMLVLVISSAVIAQTVDFESDIQPIFTNNCISCHGGATPQNGLSLESGQSLANLVNTLSTGYSAKYRVLTGDTTNSVIHNKINGTNSATFGGQMPPSGGGLSTVEKNKIATWIMELAMIPLDIAEAKMNPDGAFMTIKGIVTSPNLSASYTSPPRSDYTVQDPTAALNLYAFTFDNGLELGDSVMVTGELDNYNGKFEIIPDAETDVVVISSGNALPAFQTVTIAELIANGENYESELIIIDSARVVSGTWPPDPGPRSGVNMTITDPTGETLTMRIDIDTDIYGTEPMLGYFELKGFASQYDSSDPYDSGYQVFPRFYSDLTPIGDPAPLISDISQDPPGPTPTDDVTITANIVDNVSVESASISYTVDNGVEMAVAMTAGAENSYSGVIPAQAGNALVKYTLNATDNYGNTSTSSEYSYIVYGGIVTSIASIQDGTVAVDSIVTVQGIVTAESYAFGMSYYFIQDAETPWSGIKVDDPDRPMAQGDEIRFKATVEEYYDMTELVDVSAYEVLSTGHHVEPMIIALDADMEQYEGCLVRIENVVVDNPDLGYGEWSVSDGTNTMVIDDAADYFYSHPAGETLASVTGILDYSHSAFKIQPRLAIDIPMANGFTRIQAIQQVNYSDLLPHYKELDNSLYFRDTSYYFAGWTDSLEVTVEGLVTMPTGLSYAGAGVKFIFQDASGGPWSSILCYDPDSLTFPTLREGYKIQATGYISEFTTPSDDGAASMTEFFITQDIEVVAINQDLPTEPLVNTGDLRWPTTAEQWGNVVVRVENARIIENNPTDFDILAIDDGSGIVYVDDDSDSLANYIQPPAGSKYDIVRGWVYHHYGEYSDSTTYKLVPLYVRDLILNTVSAEERILPDTYAIHNYPNPFNPSTNIRFSIPEANTVQLLIYNQLGQLVATLVDESLNAGEYEIAWRGMDSRGMQLASGLYFYRLIAGDTQLVGKMTYLK
ncbi:MAG: T9SS type A sorting domain-containing protein [Candidatus Marinimicrobia bacterium]|nr:T9SS type A sorting domain-containing protein [Candidatus Neomarinimicrobiota bacterium]